MHDVQANSLILSPALGVLQHAQAATTHDLPGDLACAAVGEADQVQLADNDLVRIDLGQVNHGATWYSNFRGIV